MARKRDPGQLNLYTKKPVAKMPEGYYSGDRPNPNLRAFVEQHQQERPYDPETDDFDVPAFDKPIETTKATAIYNMHTYWSKKPHDAIRQYIRHYTIPGDLVLDPMCGSGGTALAALMEGRKAIAIDRSPAATFITKNYCTPVDVDELQRAFEELKNTVKPEIDWLYETRCNRCGGKARTAYMVYSQVFQCQRCLKKMPLFDCVEVQGKTAKGKPKKISACPHCHKNGIVEEISTRGEKFGAVLVLVSYLCESGCRPARGDRRHNDASQEKRKYFEKYDLGKIREIEAKEIPHWYPKDRMMHAPEEQECWGVKWRAGTSNFRTVDELHTKSNLWALSAILTAIKRIQNNHLREAIQFCWNSVLLNLSRMTTNRDRLGFLKGTYYTPPICRCTNVLGTLENKLRMLIPGWQAIHDIETNSLCISTSDARFLDMPSNSVDYIFTDPPYADKEQYGELNFVWEAWLGFDTHWHEDEIIINKVRGRTEKDWSKMILTAMKQCYRVLKPRHWLSLCYHDTSEGSWALVQEIMSEIGFIVDETDAALFIDTGQKSYNQKVADKVTKRDLVINFQKPNDAGSKITISGREDKRIFREKVLKIIHDYLIARPGETKDRIYDEVVSRLVRKGLMEAFDFDEVLTEIAYPISEPIKKDLFRFEDPNLFGTHEIKRWYLKEEMDQVDEEETVREDAAAAKIEAYMAKYLKEHPERQGVHYSDLFEQIVTMDRPRREMADWLIDYFFKTEEGTWRPTMTDEEREEKARQRATGALRKIKSFARLLESAAVVPERLQPESDREITEWVHQARRAGLYHQGKVIYEKSGLNLSRLEDVDENLAMDVNEDYQYCLKLLGEG